MLLNLPVLGAIQIGFIVLSLAWLLRRNDEIPLLISCLVFYYASYRFWAVSTGFGAWVNLANLGLPHITEEDALQCLNYIVLGQVCLLSLYFWRQKERLPVVQSKGNDLFFNWLRPRALALTFFCLLLAIITRSIVEAEISAGRSLAYEISNYLYLFPLTLIGCATLIFWMWKSDRSQPLLVKFAFALIGVSVAYVTFESGLRFQFFGWIIAAGTIASCSYKPKIRLAILSLGLLVGMGMFTFAGALRSLELTTEERPQAALERFLGAEDANMLDGFVLLKNVYQDLTGYTWGAEHLEIVVRPIPRAWWPQKPVAGYMSKLGLNETIEASVGISPSLFGSFYGEGGVVGIVVFSFLYGLVLVYLVRLSTRFKPFAGVLVRSMVCASLVPLLRGGDLPGIYAWIGLAFWQCFLTLLLKRRELYLTPDTPPKGLRRQTAVPARM